MAKSKQELLDEAQALGIEVGPKNTIAQIQALITAQGDEPVAEAETQASEETPADER